MICGAITRLLQSLKIKIGKTLRDNIRIIRNRKMYYYQFIKKKKILVP